MDADPDFYAPAPPSLDYLEYESGGEKWRVERGAALIEEFSLEGPESVPKLHAALAGQEPVWLILRRLFGIAPMLGVTDLDDLRVWSKDELARKLGVDLEQIDSHIAGARVYWRRWELDNGKTPETIAPARPAPPAEVIEQRLLEQGFIGVEDREERVYIAQRIEQLQPWLDSENLRASARMLIQQEVSVFFMLEPALRDLRKRMLESSQKGGTTDQRNEMKQLLGQLRESQSSLEATMKTLGITDAQGSGLRKKMGFNDCLAQLVDAIRAYYADSDKAMIDGLMTAAEVELLITPTMLRPAQYRPDLVLMALEAKEHLWEREWSPTPMSRRTCRKLSAGFTRGLAEARSEAGEPEDLPVDDAEEDFSEADSALPSEAPLAAAPGQPSATPTMPPPRPHASRRQESATAVSF